MQTILHEGEVSRPKAFATYPKGEATTSEGAAASGVALSQVCLLLQ